MYTVFQLTVQFGEAIQIAVILRYLWLIHFQCMCTYFLVCVEWNECHNSDTAVSAGCSETQLMPYVHLNTVRLHNIQSFLYPLFTEIVSSIRPEIPVRVLPGDTRLNTFTFLTCLPEPSTLNQSDYVSRWTIPSGVTFTSMTNLPGFERFRVSQGGVTTPQGNRQSTLLIVLNLTYQDAGNYTCEVRRPSAPAQSPWLSTSVELQLEGKNV